MNFNIDATVLVTRSVSGKVLAPASAQDLEILKAQVASLIASTGEITLALDDDGNLIAKGTAIIASVSSVNGKTGTVTINAAEVGAAAEDHTHAISQIYDFPVLADVATSGSYNDLSDLPTIPTVTNDFTTAYKNKLDAMTTETWTFTLSDGSTVEKKVVIYNA